MLYTVEYLSISEGACERSLNFPYKLVRGTWLVVPPVKFPCGILGRFFSYFSSKVNWFLLGHGLENEKVLRLFL